MSPEPARLSKEDAAAQLNRGGVLLLPTDTIVGLHCRADRTAAIERINALKGRDSDQPLLVLASDLEQVGRVAPPLSGDRAGFCARCWPGPFTLILAARTGLPAALTGGGATVAVRVPAWPLLRELIELVGHPLVSTSCNLSGQAPRADLQQAVDLFGEVVDGVWDPLEDSLAGGKEDERPSALIDVVAWPPRLLRPGPVPPPPWEGAGDS